MIYHPDLEDSYSTVSVEAFEEVWKDQGWERAEGLVDENGDPVFEDEPDPNLVAPPTPPDVTGKQDETAGQDKEDR